MINSVLGPRGDIEALQKSMIEYQEMLLPPLAKKANIHTGEVTKETRMFWKKILKKDKDDGSHTGQ